MWMVQILAAIGIVVIAAIFSLLMAFPVMWCWEVVIVPTFGMPSINWIQAWCLMFLADILFKTKVTYNQKQ
jgi:hypothetical protein